MRDLVTTNDPVLLSYLLVLLEDAGIEAVVFDGNMSAVQGTLGAVAQRLAVPSRELGRGPPAAGRCRPRPVDGKVMSVAPATHSRGEVTDDAFLGGALNILQLRNGYRAGLDAVMLAAAVPADASRPLRVLDVGAGVGTAGSVPRPPRAVRRGRAAREGAAACRARRREHRAQRPGDARARRHRRRRRRRRRTGALWASSRRASVTSSPIRRSTTPTPARCRPTH